MEESQERGLRYNQGKNRLALQPAHAVSEISKVFTYGANKYTIKLPDGTLVKGDQNWRKGIDWMSVMDSHDRHINAWKSGECVDPESGCQHLAHAAVNLMFLIEYAKIFPQGDDRPTKIYSMPRVGLDIDDVLADFVPAWCRKFGYSEHPKFWNFDRQMLQKLEAMKNDEEFWLGLELKTRPDDLPFEPVCYISSRCTNIELTQRWLDDNGFPQVPLIQLEANQSKLDAAKNMNLDWFVDDRFDTFATLNKNGVFCWLMDAEHNRRFDVGYKRISSVSDLKTYLY